MGMDAPGLGKKESKPNLFLHAFERLESEVGCLDNLIGRIEGKAILPETKSMEKGSSPSISAIMGEFPDRICGSSSRLEEIRKRLEDALF